VPKRVIVAVTPGVDELTVSVVPLLLAAEKLPSPA
jgi:hypothetical protein